MPFLTFPHFLFIKWIISRGYSNSATSVRSAVKTKLVYNLTNILYLCALNGQFVVVRDAIGHRLYLYYTFWNNCVNLACHISFGGCSYYHFLICNQCRSFRQTLTLTSICSAFSFFAHCCLNRVRVHFHRRQDLSNSPQLPVKCLLEKCSNFLSFQDSYTSLKSYYFGWVWKLLSELVCSARDWANLGAVSRWRWCCQIEEDHYRLSLLQIGPKSCLILALRDLSVLK